MNEDLLGNCRACGREVSRRALECPECGEPRPTLTEQEYQFSIKTWYDKKKDSILSTLQERSIDPFNFIVFGIAVVFFLSIVVTIVVLWWR